MLILVPRYSLSHLIIPYHEVKKVYPSSILFNSIGPKILRTRVLGGAEINVRVHQEGPLKINYSTRRYTAC